MSFAEYDKDLLLKWVEVAEEIAEKKIEEEFKAAFENREAENRKKYSFALKFMPWLYNLLYATSENYERNSFYGLRIHIVIRYDHSFKAIRSIRSLASSSTGKVYLDSETAYHGLVRLGFNHWIKKDNKDV